MSLWTPFAKPQIAERWFSWPNIVILAPVPIVTALIAYWEWRSLNNRSEAAPFIGAILLFVMSYLGIAISLFPLIVPYKFTLWDAASSPSTQAFLLVGTVFLLPVILMYTGWSYWVFRGKVRGDLGLSLTGDRYTLSAEPNAASGAALACRRSAAAIARLAQTIDNRGSKERALVPGPTSIFDVVIAGGGASGLALAAAIKQAMREGASIAVVDPAASPAASATPLRTVAIAEGPRRLLEHIGAWDGDRATRATDPVDGDHGRATCATPCACPIFISHRKTARLSPIWRSTTMSSARSPRSAIGSRFDASRRPLRIGPGASGSPEIGLSDGRALRARLAVAADGARSKLSRLADIQTIGWDYDQSGIVATVAHKRDHEGRAEQHFLPAGPFAVLPLPGRQSSIVWNERRADARALLALDSEELTRQLEYRFTPKLGEIRLASRVEAFPFRFQIARRFVAERLALVGDAAHVVHPVAGQGLNLGLRDVAALAETIVGEMRLGLDPGAPAPLAAYQRQRRFDVAASGLGLDALNRLFSNDLAPLRFARDLGLRLVDRAPALKDMLIAEAGGAGSGAPKLLRGLAL